MDASRLGLVVAAAAHADAPIAVKKEEDTGGASRATASSAKVVSFNNPL